MPKGLLETLRRMLDESLNQVGKEVVDLQVNADIRPTRLNPRPPYGALSVSPKNKRAAQMVVYVYDGDIVLVVGNNNARLHLENLSSAERIAQALSELHDVFTAVIEGRYSERIVQIPGGTVVSTTATIDIGPRKIRIGRGLPLPLPAVTRRYEPYLPSD